MKKYFLTALFLLSTSLSFAYAIDGTFIGELTTNQVVKLHLHQNGTQLYGSFGYDTDKRVSYVPNAQTLQGQIGVGGYVTLKHLYDNGEVNLFEGYLDPKTMRLRGDWIPQQNQPIDLKPLVTRFENAQGQQLTVARKTTRTGSQIQQAKIVLHYPQLMQAGQQATDELKAFNYLISNRIFKTKKDFERDVKRAELTGQHQLNTNNSLKIDYDITYASWPFISVRLNVETFYAGMPHPISASSTINYDLQKSEQVSMDYFFKQYSTFLYELAAVSRQQLKTVLPHLVDKRSLRFMKYWIHYGTEAKEHNFKNWNLTPIGFLISFDPYQVAPYAYGRHEIIIPYAFFNEDYKAPYQSMLS